MQAVGATGDLSLRVSVATLVRVVFTNPEDGELRLALERKAALHSGENGQAIEVKSQPFGGAVRIRDQAALRGLIGEFHFDSERSSREQDFRIFIKPANWAVVREFCVQHFSRFNDPILETEPGRELAEEFAQALKVKLRPDQYIQKPVDIVVQANPLPTENIRAKGSLTARVYRVFEMYATDAALARSLQANSDSFSDMELIMVALEDIRKGGKGLASAILSLPVKRISAVYAGIPPDERAAPLLLEDNRLDATVPVILEGISIPGYQRL
jgi:hypothetical protein